MSYQLNYNNNNAIILDIKINNIKEKNILLAKIIIINLKLQYVISSRYDI